MIGETGAGKSSCLNTFATAITGSKEIKDIYRVSPGKGREKSATQRVMYRIKGSGSGETSNKAKCTRQA